MSKLHAGLVVSGVAASVGLVVWDYYTEPIDVIAADKSYVTTTRAAQNGGVLAGLIGLLGRAYQLRIRIRTARHALSATSFG